jgi:hypothetical protein
LKNVGISIFLFLTFNSFGQTDCESKPDIFNGQIVYTTVDSFPSFSGGLTKFLKYLRENISFQGETSSIKSTYRATFIIDTLGQVQKVCLKTEDGVLSANENAIKEALEKSPKWMPGQLKNKKVCVRYNLPISIHPK